jgi:hypothetical protein
MSQRATESNHVALAAFKLVRSFQRGCAHARTVSLFIKPAPMEKHSPCANSRRTLNKHNPTLVDRLVKPGLVMRKPSAGDAVVF